MASHDLKKALKRLKKDQQELVESPLPNVSAAPLEDNFLEWHCNIQYGSHLYHLILFFPKEYPCIPPRLEIVPPGFAMENVVVRKGDKGTQVCLDIFSDFADVHPEWLLLSDSGWSPSYTVQAILLNLLSYLDDKHHEEDQTLMNYLETSKTFVCADCGHSRDSPSPPLNIETQPDSQCVQSVIDHKGGSQNEVSLRKKSREEISKQERPNNCLHSLESKIMDYVSRDKFSMTEVSSNTQVFGFGLILSQYSEDCCPISPCEFVTATSFHEMCGALGEGQSIHRKRLSHFLPLYITKEHAANIRPYFESTMTKISKQFRFRFSFTNNYIHVMITVLCNLMASLVDECYFSSGGIMDTHLDGYFQIHRLFLWAVDTFPKVMKYIHKRIESFLSNPSLQKRRSEYDFRYLFALLSINTRYTWESVADVYLREHWRRTVQWCAVRCCNFTCMDLPMEDRLRKTFQLTLNDCQRLAFHVAFLKKVWPAGMSKEDILQQYAENLSFPSQETVFELRNTLKTIISDIKSFDEWFHIIGLPVPCEYNLFLDLKDSLEYALATKGYRPRWIASFDE